MEIKTLTVNGQTFTVADPDALHREDIATLVSFDPQQLSAAQKAQARANIGAASDAGNVPDQSAYFDIDYDGVVSLKAEYRADGSKNGELPEIIVIPDVIDGTAVSGLQPGMFRSDHRVKEITIPNGVTELPDQFCSGAKNLRAIHNTEHITKLGTRVILNSQVKQAIFPNLREAADGALVQGKFLYMVDIGNFITDIPYAMFRMCPLLSLVKGGGSVKTIGKEAFYWTKNLKNLPFLSQVTSIGDMAFLRSRVQFDWSTITGQCTFGTQATPVIDNTTDYWTGVEYTPCENRIVTMMSQANPQWKDDYFGEMDKTYYRSCSTFAALHIHSALSGKLYTHPDEFAEELYAIDPTLVTVDKNPTYFANVAPFFHALGYKTTVYEADLTKESYQAMCDALARGAYIYTQVSVDNYPNEGHAVALYGINSIGEVLVLDSDTVHSSYKAYGADDIFTYRMPYQNLTGPSSNIVIVEKGE